MKIYIVILLAAYLNSCNSGIHSEGFFDSKELAIKNAGISQFNSDLKNCKSIFVFKKSNEGIVYKLFGRDCLVSLVGFYGNQDSRFKEVINGLIDGMYIDNSRFPPGRFGHRFFFLINSENKCYELIIGRTGEVFSFTSVDGYFSGRLKSEQAKALFQLMKKLRFENGFSEPPTGLDNK